MIVNVLSENFILLLHRHPYPIIRWSLVKDEGKDENFEQFCDRDIVPVVRKLDFKTPLHKDTPQNVDIHDHNVD
jgi:hypothetical protein